MNRNYGPTVLSQKEAEKLGYNQILWLYGPDHQVTEVGTMNMFVAIKNKNGTRSSLMPRSPTRHDRCNLTHNGMLRVAESNTGEKELVTAPTPSDGVVLSGVTRDSIIQLVKQLPGWRVSERCVALCYLLDACCLLLAARTCL
jgi:branched-chain amino acid aminotransferase